MRPGRTQQDAPQASQLAGTMEVSTASDDSATAAGGSGEPEVQDCPGKQGLGELIAIQHGRTATQDDGRLNATATGCGEPIAAGRERQPRDPGGNGNESWSSAGSTGVGNANVWQVNTGGETQLDNAPSEGAEASSGPEDAESNDLWSDFMQFRTFAETSSRTNGQTAERETDGVRSWSFPDQHRKLSPSQKCTFESCSSPPNVNVCPLKSDAFKPDIPGEHEEVLPLGNDSDLSAEQCLLARPSLKWEAFKGDVSPINDTSGGCETDLSDSGTDGSTLPAANALLQKQNDFPDSSALKASTATHLVTIFQTSFPFVCEKHPLENIPTLEECLGMSGEGNGANKVKASSSNGFVSVWGSPMDLNRTALRSWWNGSHARENLLSTLPLAHREKFPSENVLPSSTLEKIGTYPKVTALPEYGNKPLIQTRISIPPKQRNGHTFTHRLESAFLQWLQTDGKRVRANPNAKQNPLFL